MMLPKTCLILLLAALCLTSPVDAQPAASTLLEQVQRIKAHLEASKMSLLQVHFNVEPSGQRSVELGISMGNVAHLATFLDELAVREPVAVRHLRLDAGPSHLQARLKYQPVETAARSLGRVLTNLGGRLLWRPQWKEEEAPKRFVATRLVLSDSGDLAVEGFVEDLPSFSTVIAGLEKSPLYADIQPMGIKIRKAPTRTFHDTGFAAKVK